MPSSPTPKRTDLHIHEYSLDCVENTPAATGDGTLSRCVRSLVINSPPLKINHALASTPIPSPLPSPGLLEGSSASTIWRSFFETLLLTSPDRVVWGVYQNVLRSNEAARTRAHLAQLSPIKFTKGAHAAIKRIRYDTNILTLYAR